MYAVIFVGPEQGGNVGALARVMANFGLSRLILVNPRCRPGGEAIARAKHAASIVEDARVVKSLGAAAEGFDFLVGTTGKPCHDYDRTRPCVSPREFASLERPKGSIALVFGRESTGLTNDELALCDAVLNIPADPRYPVLNVSHAAAIIFYELLSQKESGARKADRAEKEALQALFGAVADRLPGIRDKAGVKKTFRNVIGRSMIAGREAHTLAGAFKEAERYLNRGPQKRV